MIIAAYLFIAGLALIAVSQIIDRIAPIQEEPETGPYFDNVIQFPVRRQA